MAVLMPLEIKHHTVPQLKVLNIGLGPSIRHGSNFIGTHVLLKSAHFTKSNPK